MNGVYILTISVKMQVVEIKQRLDQTTRRCNTTEYVIKYIHRQFLSFKLKLRFFNTYTWPHLYVMSTIHCLLSKSLKEEINGFYRRCRRMIYHLFQCPTNELHQGFCLPTLEEKYRNCLTKRLSSIKQYEQELISYYLMHINIVNKTRYNYLVKLSMQALSRGQSNTRIHIDRQITSFIQWTSLVFMKFRKQKYLDVNEHHICLLIYI